MQMFNPGIEANQVSGFTERKFVIGQDQPDQVLLEEASDVVADPAERKVSVKCTAKVARALKLKPSTLLPGWSHEVVTR
jgi:hypothetical protein